MTLISRSQSPSEPVPTAMRIPQSLRLSAAERLVSAPGRREAAKRLIASAPAHGIDLDLMWGVPEQAPPGAPPKRVRQVVLAVLGTGRTAMLFLSNPDSPRSLGPHEQQTREIAAALSAALAGLRDYAPGRVTLAQTLIEPGQTWAKTACTDSGMIPVGRLDYMRKRVDRAELTSRPRPDWPESISVRPIRSLDPGDPGSDYPALVAALEGSYIDTLDCPELCGLRGMDDVVASHKATGEFDPARWHLIFKDDEPAGCCLLSHCPPNDAVELVYLGIAPCARGLGLGRRVLRYAIGSLGDIGAGEVSCAVDNRNAPAIAIYESLGFERFDARLGFVAPIAPRA